MQEIYDVEQGYLGAILIDPDVIEANHIDPLDMKIVKHREILSLAQKLKKEHGTVDYLLLSQNYEDPSYLTALIANTPSALHAEAYAKEIRKAAERRELLDIASQMANDAAKGEANHNKYIEMIVNSVRVTGNTKSMATDAEEYKAYVAERVANPSIVWGIPAPWEQYNLVTGGIHKGKSVMFYGLPGAGKTVCVGQIAYHAIKLGYKVDFYSLEMSNKRLMSRFVSMRTLISEQAINRGDISKGQWRRVNEAADQIAVMPLRISDETHWTSAEIRADQQRKGNDKADMVIVDYLAKLKDRGENSHEIVEHASNALQDMAKDLDIALVNVSSEVKDGSIKGTREVEHAQDHVWHVERAANADPNDPVRYLYPRKLRDCPAFGGVNLKFTEKGIPMLEEW